MRELLKLYRPIIAILLEPKINDAIVNEVGKRIMMTRWGHSKAPSFSGVTWVLWNDAEIDILIKNVHKFFLHLRVMRGYGRQWELMAVYAYPNASKRRRMWDSLDIMIVEGPWALSGDFNCVLRMDERNSGGAVSSSFVD